MDVLREKISGDIKKFSELFDELTEKGFIIKGDSYKKDHFSEITECSTKNILNMKSFSVSKSKIVDETVYSENLKTELENAFLDLEELMEMLDD